MTRPAPVVRCERVMQIHRSRDVEVIALSGIDLVVEPGELVGIVGPSGSGKSSLLALLGGLSAPSAGRVEVLGQDMGRLSERQRLRMRAEGIGIMGQNPERNLLPYGRVLDNLTFAQRGRGASGHRGHRGHSGHSGRRRRGQELLAMVGLHHHARSRVGALSGGEQQRLALAVALAGEPRLLLADEPTSQLDPASRDLVADLLRTARDQTGVTVLTVTHDRELGALMDRSLAMRDGRLGIEHRTGEAYAMVAPDGSIQLPVDLADAWPAGSRVRFVRVGGHLEVHPVVALDPAPTAADGPAADPDADSTQGSP